MSTAKPIQGNTASMSDILPRIPADASTDDVLAFWGEFPEKPTWYSLWPSAMVNTFLRKAGWINTGPLTKREEIPHDALMNEDFMRELFTIPPFHVYSVDSFQVAADVREWCLAEMDDPTTPYRGPRYLHPRLRIALCGYKDEHDAHLSDDWERVHWVGPNGHAGQTGHPVVTRPGNCRPRPAWKGNKKPRRCRPGPVESLVPL